MQQQLHPHDLPAAIGGYDDISAAGLGVIAGGEPTQGHFIGIKALMLAVLDDAIIVYLGRAGRVQDEAEDWIMTAGRRSPFAFAVICEMLGLEPDAVRAVLRQWRARKLPVRRALGRTRGNAKATRAVPSRP
jgi:hypothetical protein